MLNFFWNHWLILSFVAPALWAMTNLIDVYFVEDVYEEASDGFIISSLFQIAAWVVVPIAFSGFSWPAFSAGVLSVVGGVVFMTAFYFYFKALFAHNDVALVQILWTLTVPLVSIFSWIFLGEQLSTLQYVGILVAFIGAMLLSYGGELHALAFRKVGHIMAGAIIALSFSMIIQKHVFDISSDDAFWGIYLLFSLGATIPGAIVWFQSRNRRIVSLCRSYYGVFLAAESCALLGYLTSERTLKLSPSPSFVAVIESFVPVFVMVFSFLILGIAYLLKKRDEKLQAMYTEQIDRFWLKVSATAILAFGIYLLT